MLQFPSDFFWGAATAAHQVEGNNTHSDFWLMENMEGSLYKEPSGDAVDHYRLYREDIALLAKLGLNTYRFSIEWARIEPEEGQFNEAAINHYRDVLETCKKLNITPIVTLHHFSSPHWLIRDGGWESEGTPARFAKYCAHVMRELGTWIPYVCTINEVNIAIGIAKMIKQFVSGGTSAAQVGMNTDMQEQMKKYYSELSNVFGIPPMRCKHFFNRVQKKDWRSSSKHIWGQGPQFGRLVLIRKLGLRCLSMMPNPSQVERSWLLILCKRSFCNFSLTCRMMISSACKIIHVRSMVQMAC
jgi:beta-glucosidase